MDPLSMSINLVFSPSLPIAKGLIIKIYHQHELSFPLKSAEFCFTYAEVALLDVAQGSFIFPRNCSSYHDVLNFSSQSISSDINRVQLLSSGIFISAITSLSILLHTVP